MGDKLDTEELQSFFKCSVCCGEYVDPVLTKCGHNFCRECIEECINRNHKCPECNANLMKENLFKNIQIGRVQRQVQELKNKAKNEIVENLLALESGFGNNRNLVLSIMQDSIKDQIARIEQYCENAKKQGENDIRKVKAKYASLPESKRADPQTKLEMQKEIEHLENKCALIIDYHLKAYEDNINKAFIEVEMLPIKMSIHVAQKNVIIDPVHLSPIKPLSEIKIIIENHFKKISNPIVKWGSDIIYEIYDILGRPFISIPISEESRTFQELKILQEAKIEFKGTIVCESDIPKPCITLNFRTEDKKEYNYYSCETCSLNWICEPCLQQCHKDHTYKNHLKNHVPTWACCYCLKKGCKLPKKNNPIGAGGA